ncbi:MAG: DUF624 domain-containing protein [Oscillospiraceae bacterium]|nr:DUF624 domain-containing protein [Oscillospiraceae bacterium]
MKEKETFMDKLGKVVTMAGTAILMNLMFLIACIPIVTIGPAWNGLLTSVRYNIRGDGWFQGFKAGYTTRFWRSLISWCICLPLCWVFLADLNNAIQGGNPLDIGICGLFFAMATMVTMALQFLNVYIPTGIAQWLRNAVNFFRYPLMLFVAAMLFWAPVLIALLWDMIIFVQIIMIFIAVYFTLAAVASTMLLKDGLLDFLQEARENGTLLAEEGSQPLPKDEEEE